MPNYNIVQLTSSSIKVQSMRICIVFWEGKKRCIINLYMPGKNRLWKVTCEKET